MDLRIRPDPLVVGQRVASLPSGVARASGCNTTRPFPAGGPAARIHGCRETQGVIVVLDQARAHRDLASAAPVVSWLLDAAAAVGLRAGPRQRTRRDHTTGII